MIQRVDDAHVEINLDERGWIARYNADGWLRAAGHWFLVRKADNVVAAMLRINDGEQPYYVTKHVGFVRMGDATESVAYGIGKKRLDGHVDRIWVLTNGTVLTGDDVEPILIHLLKRGLIVPG